MDSLGDRIKSVREALGISRPDLARRTGVGYSTIAEIERGGMRSTTKLHVIARELGVSDEWLATGRGVKERGQTYSVCEESPQPYLLPPDEQEILDVWRSLDKDSRRTLRTVGLAIATGKLKHEPGS